MSHCIPVKAGWTRIPAATGRTATLFYLRVSDTALKNRNLLAKLLGDKTILTGSFLSEKEEEEEKNDDIFSASFPFQCHLKAILLNESEYSADFQFQKRQAIGTSSTCACVKSLPGRAHTQRITAGSSCGQTPSAV